MKDHISAPLRLWVLWRCSCCSGWILTQRDHEATRQQSRGGIDQGVPHIAGPQDSDIIDDPLLLPLEPAGGGPKKLEEQLTKIATIKGKLPPQMKIFVSSIRQMLEETFLPSLKKEYRHDQVLLNRTRGVFDTCSMARAGFERKAWHIQKRVDNLSSRHRSCRRQQYDATKENSECEVQLGDINKIMTANCNAKANISGSILDAAKSCHPEDNEQYGNYVKRVESSFKEKAKVFKHYRVRCRTARAQHVKVAQVCEPKKKIPAAKKVECDKVQRRLESEGCLRQSAAGNYHAAYDVCYAKAVERYEEQRAMAKTQEARRLDDFRAVKRIECLLNVLEKSDGKRSEAEVQECKKKVHDSQDLRVVAPDPPPKVPPLLSPAPLPCSEAWRLVEYAGLPRLAPAAACRQCPKDPSSATLVAVDTPQGSLRQQPFNFLTRYR